MYFCIAVHSGACPGLKGVAFWPPGMLSHTIDTSLIDRQSQDFYHLQDIFSSLMLLIECNFSPTLCLALVLCEKVKRLLKTSINLFFAKMYENTTCQHNKQYFI